MNILTPYSILASLLLAVIPAAAQDLAPSSLSVPSTLDLLGLTRFVYPDGIEFEAGGIYTITSATAFTAPRTTGTYTYVKNGAHTGRISYTANYSFGGDTDTQIGLVNLTFTSLGGGTYTLSGTNSGIDSGFLYSGTFVFGGIGPERSVTITPVYAETAPVPSPSRSPSATARSTPATPSCSP